LEEGVFAGFMLKKKIAREVASEDDKARKSVLTISRPAVFA
jgi:hypothetical protein